jgi:hypothetical protein
MYCSENCRNSDWSSAHKGECNNKLIMLLPSLTPLVPLKLEEYASPDNESVYLSILSVTLRLISYIGLENIKKTVLENKPMASLLEDPRTKGFQDGKFETDTLEALLSLEDNFDRLTGEELSKACDVSSTKLCVLVRLISIAYMHLETRELKNVLNT